MFQQYALSSYALTCALLKSGSVRSDGKRRREVPFPRDLVGIVGVCLARQLDLVGCTAYLASSILRRCQASGRRLCPLYWVVEADMTLETH